MVKINKMHLLVPCLFLIIINGFSQGPNKNDQKMIKKIRGIADEFYRIGEYHNALNAYQDIDSIQPDQPDITYKLAICHLYNQEIGQSIKYFEKASSFGQQPLDFDYYWGKALHSNHEFEKAIEKYNEYLNKRKEKKQTDAHISETDVEMLKRQCERGIKYIAKPVPNITITNLGPNVNSTYAEYGPLISRDESVLIFTSTRKDDNEILNPFSGEYYEDIYVSKKENGKWSKATNIGKPINSTGVHNAAVGLSPDGQKLIVSITSNELIKLKETGDLYLSTIDSGTWSEPKFIEGGLNSSSWEPSVSMTEDENTIVFTSDRAGGKGGRDIYMMKRLPNGNWATPFNISDHINTEFDEDGPFIHPDGDKLYFSSKGHDGMGGFDIFYSEYNKETNEWTKPRNLGYPINTALDDIFFVWSADGERAYFSSKRTDSYGNTDLYMISRDDEKFANVVLTGKLLDAENQQPVSAIIAVRDRYNNFVVGTYTSNPETEEIDMVLKSGRDYVIEVVSGNYKANDLNISVPESNEFYSLEKNLYIFKE